MDVCRQSDMGGRRQPSDQADPFDQIASRASAARHPGDVMSGDTSRQTKNGTPSGGPSWISTEIPSKAGSTGTRTKMVPKGETDSRCRFS